MFFKQHFLGAYDEGGEYRLIHWTKDLSELKKCSELEALEFYPTPYSDHEFDEQLFTELQNSNSAFVAEYYQDCLGAYVVGVKNKKITQCQLRSVSDLKSAVEPSGGWARVIFVLENDKGKIITCAGDVYIEGIR